MARALAEALGCRHLELDSVYHQPGWEPIPNEQFRARIESFMATEDRWVIDGNYTSHGIAELVWPNADTIVWMDPPKSVVMSQIVRRTVPRAFLRRELWNGNTEDWRNLFSRVPEDNIVLWAWTTFDQNRERYAARLGSDEWVHLDVHRVQSRSDARDVLAEAERTA